jgi:protein-disulfide isomerase
MMRVRLMTDPPAKRTITAVLSQLTVRLLVAAVLVSLTVSGAAWVLHSRQIASLRQDVAALKAQVARSGTGATFVDVRNAPALGPESAVVTLVEFSDYECPYCIRHFTQTMPQIEADYIRSGKIRYVFRDFPIDENHPQAIRAHEASRCALEQQKFWDLHVRLFSKPGTHTADQIDARAAEAGVDLTALHACLASGRTTAGIRNSAAVAVKLGADGTPAFFIGLRDLRTEQVRVTRTLSGAQPYPVFQQALDATLALPR